MRWCSFPTRENVVLNANDIKISPACVLTVAVLIALVASFAGVPAVAVADGSARSANASSGPARFSTELTVLERDLTSGDYRAVLATMIPTDLEAEWLRVATSDNYLVFSEQHGGAAKIAADSALKRDYDRRKQIADTFLAMIRDAYKNRRKKPPFDDPSKLENALRSAGRRTAKTNAEAAVPVRTVMPAEGAENQWPRLRGPDGQGTAMDADLPLHWGAEENVVWKVAVPGRGNSSPVVWGNRIFITYASDDGTQRKIGCFSRDQGRLLWEATAPPAREKERLYKKNTFASSTPVTDGKRVIALFGNSGLFCVDFEGHPQWHTDVGLFPIMHGPGTSPVLFKDKVICVQYQNRGDTLFAAYDKRTGAKLWQQNHERATSWSTPVVLRVGDHDELVYNGANYVAGYDPETGNELWRAAGSTHESIPTTVVGDGLLFSASGRNGPTMAIRPGGKGDVTETHIVWKNPRGGPHVPSPLYHDERLYIVNDTGIATCLDAKTGRTVWQHRLRGRFSMSPVEAGGRILVTNEDGYSTILKAGDSYHVLAENDLKEGVLATPALLNGRLYFRSAEHLWCIGKTAVSAR